MNFLSKIIFLSLTLFFIGCQVKKEKPITIQNNNATKIIHEAIEAHGGEHYENTYYSFEFRGNEYGFINQKNSYRYNVKSINKRNEIIDVLENGVFSRETNNILTRLDTSESSKYSSSLNSVIYFTLLPYKLNDASVNKKDKGIVNIKEKKYHAIEVTFNQEGGGEDYDDVFYYWINTTSKTVDYLAYKYHVNGGGIRFREAYNVRNIGGVLFQDYINYKAPTHLALEKLPTLFNEDKLLEVSRIELKKIKNHH